MIAIMSIYERLAGLAGRERQLSAGTFLFRNGDRVLSLFLVRTGEVRLVRMLPHGFQLTMQRAGPASVLAEASLFADRYHCDALAAEDCSLLAVPAVAARAALETDAALASMLARHLAAEVQQTRTRAEILSLKSAADRVDAWLAFNGEALPPKGRWNKVASEIGISPEALYRELARRRRPPGNDARRRCG